MANHALFIGWNRPVIGRETIAVELFQSVVGYLGKQREDAARQVAGGLGGGHHEASG